MFRLYSTLAVCAAMLFAGCSKNGGGGEDEPKTYTVTVTSGDNGTAKADKTTAAEGETVTLTADNPADGYVFKQWACESVTFLPDATTAKVSFAMPAKNVIVSAEFVAAEYTVTVTSGGNGEAKPDKTAATEGETVKLTATPDPGCEFVKWTVESGGVTCSPDATTNPATFTMPAGIVSIKAEFSKGVLINGVAWAPCNVDAPGTFAAKPENAGMFYQWNRKVGWSSTELINSDGGTTWDTTNAEGDEWAAANDPCPAGWRVPTTEEQAALCDDAKTTIGEWTELNDIYGRWFTDKISGNSVFFPASGNRHSASGAPTNVGSYGLYWSDTPSSAAGARCLNFYSGAVYPQSSNNRAAGYAVRCVAE